MIFTQKKACQKPDMPFVLNVKKNQRDLYDH